MASGDRRVTDQEGEKKGRDSSRLVSERKAQEEGNKKEG